jgi:hypothetical protein
MNKRKIKKMYNGEVVLKSDVLKALNKIMFDVYYNSVNIQTTEPNIPFELTIHSISKIPSLIFTEDDKKEKSFGRWIYDPNGMDWNLPAWKCSECYCRNDMIPTIIQTKDGIERLKNPMTWAGTKYCPNCGVKMLKGIDECLSK